MSHILKEVTSPDLKLMLNKLHFDLTDMEVDHFL